MILTVIHPSGGFGSIVADELFSVIFPYEVLGGAAPERTARVDVHDQDPFTVKFKEIRTFPDSTMAAITFAEGTLIFPVPQVVRGPELDFLTGRQDYLPLI